MSARKKIKGAIPIAFEELPTENLRSELMFWWKHVHFGNGCEGNTFDDHVLVHEQRLLSLFKELYTKDTANKVIVDIGCGAIGFVHLLPVKRRYGVDPLLEQLGRFIDLEDSVKYISKGVEYLTKEDVGNVDIFFSHSSIDHWGSPIGGLRNIYKLLSTGGVLLLPHQTVFKDTVGVTQNLSHTCALSEEDLVGMLREAGFKNIKVVSPDNKTDSYTVSIIVAKGNVRL